MHEILAEFFAPSICMQKFLILDPFVSHVRMIYQLPLSVSRFNGFSRINLLRAHLKK